MSFMERSARRFVLIKAARELKKEIEKAGLDNLKILAEAGTSIVGTYLNGCSPSEKKKHKQELSALLQLGVTPEMLFSEMTRQMPQLSPIIEGKEDYKKSEIEKLTSFVRSDIVILEAMWERGQEAK